MAISLQTGLKQSQKVIMTRTLQQAIELLQLSTVDLYERIARELVENPVLDEGPPAAGEGAADMTLPLEKNLSGDESSLSRHEERQINFGEASDPGFTGEDDEDRRRRYIESATARHESLADRLLQQARLAAGSERELRVFQNIITSLDVNGFLPDDATLLECGERDRAVIARVVASIQTFDPPGCAARDVRESLLVQCRVRYPSDPLLPRILGEHFDDFRRLEYGRIGRSLGLSVDEVIEKGRMIQSLDPYPGSRYSSSLTRYIMPDIEVRLVDGEIIVSLNDDWIPTLRINSHYTGLLKKKNIEKKLRDYIQDNMLSARCLIKNIASRRNTILRVARAIMERQRDFLERGPGHLRPLTHAEIARELELHESTVSRVTSNKHAQTPWGVFDLKSFFPSRLRNAGEEGDASSDEVLMLIRDIVEREDPRRPLSDGEIVTVLGKAGFHVARRTVAKYRGRLAIPPSHTRKRINKIKPEEHP